MRVCIVCQKDVTGKPAKPVKEDSIIRFIRVVKQTFRVAANNELYVCDEDLPAHLQRRRSFERSIIIFGVLAAIVVVLLIGTILLSGRFDIWAMFSALIIGLFILLFVFVFKYAPAIEGIAPEHKAPLPFELKIFEEKTGKPESELEKPTGAKKKIRSK